MKAFFIVFILLMSTFDVQAIPALSGGENANNYYSVNVETRSTPLFAPVQKQLLKWQMVINKNVPKEMKKLKDNPSLFVISHAVFLAFLYGIFHTLGPGHGKMVVASYFLTNGAQFWRGAYIGLQVAISHVMSAVILVLFTNIALQNFFTNPEAQVFWLKIISYGIILLIGGHMLVKSMQHLLSKHQHVHSCGHCQKAEDKYRNSKEGALAWSIGLVPCTGSLLVLLYAMANDILMLGLLMVLFIATGMAITMITIGWISILSRKSFIEKRLEGHSHKAHKVKISIELLGASIITLIACLLLYSTWISQ